MLTDIDKEFDTPLEDENGELIEIIEDYDVFKSDDTGLEEKPDNFYKGVENDISELTLNISTVESIINENRDTFNTSRDRLIEIYTSILSKGEISAEDNMNIEESKEQYVSSYNAIKEAVNAKTSKTLEERLEEFKKGFVGATEDEILNILTNGGEKCWLYKDDDNNVLIDSTAIPELTVLVNKLNLIATDGENEGEIKLTPEFISLVVRSTPTQDAVERVVYKYYLSTSDKELIGGSWLDNLPSIAEQQGKFLWFKMVTLYNGDKQPTESDPICMTAQNGQDGKDGEDGADGVDGKPGVDGKDGVSMIYKGEYTSHPSNPQNGWYYRNTKDKKTYVFQDSNWYQMTIDGLDGRDGNDGKDGLSIEFKGELQSPPSNPQKNWTYKDTDNGVVYIYTGTAWEVMTYDGSNGEDGAKGQDGLSVYCTYHDSITKPSNPTGAGTTNGWHTDWTSTIIWVSQKVGANGVWGEPIRLRGEDGKDGTGINIIDKLTDTSKLPPKGNPGDCYTINGVLYVWSQQSQTWVNAGSIKGEQGEPGKNKYLHIKYSDDGRTFTSNSGETPGIYMGVLVDEVEQDSMNFNDYTWNRIRGDQGLQGIQGPKGDQGIAGNDGKTTYFHIKYSDQANGYPMSETPSLYIGTYVDYNPTDSTNYRDYTWSRFQGIQGDQGEQGIPGKNGVNGETYYLHIKYSNDGGKTFTSNNGETPGSYIGVYTDTNPNDSYSVSSYTWSKIKGEQGPQGIQGIQGQPGVGVVDVRIEYAKNQSLVNAPTSGWSTTMPSYAQGYYLWLRTGVKYSNSNSYSYSTPVCDPSWKGIDEAFGAINVTKSLIELVVREGSTQSSIQLTPGVIAAIANSDIKLSAKKILINGLLEGSGWRIDDEGNMDINDLNIRGNITCSSVNVDDLICSNIPTALNENLDINVTSGMTISETLEDIPLNLNGYTVNIYLKTNSVENIELRRHYAGVIRIFLCGYTVYGYIRGNFNNAIYRIYGGSTDTDTTLGKIMPNTGFRNGSYYYSMVFLNCPNITIENVKVYGDKVNTTNNVCIGASQKSMVDLSNITFVGAKYNVRTYSMGELYCDSSKGTSSGNSWSAGTGSRIVLNAGTQAGGGNNTYTSGNGQIISTGVTFTSTADTSSNTSSSTGTTNRVATYKPKYADTYRSTVYNNWKNDGSCRQGNWGYGNCNGAWFYGSQFSEVVGKTITKVVITVTRASGVGNSGSVSHVFQAHTHTSRPSGMPSYTDCSASLSLAWGQTGSVTITNSTVLNGIKNGTIRGFGIKSSYSSGYYSNLSNGTVKIYYKD